MKRFPLVLAALLLVLSLCACAAKAPSAEHTDAPAATVSGESTEAQQPTETSETPEPSQVPETTEASAPTESDDWADTLPEVTEDTRPPIIVKPAEPTTEPSTEPSGDEDVMDYETYQAMSEAEQLEFFNSFSDMDAFFAWYNQAKADYEASRETIILDGSTNVEIVP